MTVASESTREFDINLIVRRAFQVAGLLHASSQPDENDFALGRDLLETVIRHLSTRGIIARTVAFYDLELTAGTYRYSMPSTVLDVFGDAMYIDPDEDPAEAAGELLVSPIDRQRWQTLTSKNAESAPTLYYAHRETTPVEVFFWPIPSEAGTVRLQTQRLLANCNEGTATVDLESYWTRCLVWTLSAELAAAKTLPVGRIAYFEGKAAGLLEDCLNFAHQHVSIDPIFAHRTHFGRR